jgi:hypothetical protein
VFCLGNDFALVDLILPLRWQLAKKVSSSRTKSALYIMLRISGARLVNLNVGAGPDRMGIIEAGIVEQRELF